MKPKTNDKKARKDTFDACMKILAGGYRFTFDPPAMDAYWIGVGELDPVKMRAAFERAIREETGHFPPSPGKIRACAAPARQLPPTEKPFTPPTSAELEEMHAGIQELRKRIAMNVAAEETAAGSFAERWGIRS
jgi:hypothetical protein